MDLTANPGLKTTFSGMKSLRALLYNIGIDISDLINSLNNSKYAAYDSLALMGGICHLVGNSLTTLAALSEEHTFACWLQIKPLYDPFTLLIDHGSK